MVVELAEMITWLETDEQSDFVEGLYNNLDPFLPFLEQQSERQEKWLYYLYERFVNGDEYATYEE